MGDVTFDGRHPGQRLGVHAPGQIDLDGHPVPATDHILQPAQPIQQGLDLAAYELPVVIYRLGNGYPGVG
jgi:hypothetical protein